MAAPGAHEGCPYDPLRMAMPNPLYSYLSATIGSTLAARRAGR